MTTIGTSWAERALVAALVVLLPAGAFAAVALGSDTRGAPGAGGRVDAAGFVQEAVIGAEPDPAPNTTAGPSTTVVLPKPTLPTTTLPRGTTPTSRPPAPSTTLLPRPPAGPTTSTTAAPAGPTDHWSRTANGVTVRLRMEPALPVAGQPVTFVVEQVSAPTTCCIVHLSFGDGSDTSLLGSTGTAVCDNPTNSHAGLTTRHTFAQSGAYEVLLIVATVPCRLEVVDGRPVPPSITGTEIRACVPVGPGTALPPTCVPFDHFNPQSGLIPG